jgi:hypothetical protein
MFMVVPSRADFNVLLGSPIDKQLVTIPPVISLGPKYTIAEDEMYSMKLQPGSGFVWERELVDHDFIVMNHKETPLREENVLRTRASAYKKVTDDLTPGSVEYAISPTGWDIEK